MFIFYSVLAKLKQALRQNERDLPHKVQVRTTPTNEQHCPGNPRLQETGTRHRHRHEMPEPQDTG